MAELDLQIDWIWTQQKHILGESVIFFPQKINRKQKIPFRVVCVFNRGPDIRRSEWKVFAFFQLASTDEGHLVAATVTVAVLLLPRSYSDITTQHFKETLGNLSGHLHHTGTVESSRVVDRVVILFLV